MGGHVYLIGFGIAKNDENGANAGNASLAAIVGFADVRLRRAFASRTFSSAHDVLKYFSYMG
jgi:hypothetical protein